MSANRDDEYSKFIPQKFHYEIIPALDNKEDHYQRKTLAADDHHEQQQQQQLQQPLLQPKQQVLIIDKQQQQQLQLNYQRQQQLQKQQQQQQGKSNDTSHNEQSTVRRGILHQIIATCAVLLLSSACGMPIGYSAVLLPQLVGANGTNAEILIDIEMGSWIASVHSLATPFGSLLSGPLADFIGRRTALMIAIIPLLLGWGALALSQSFTMLIIGRLLCGCGVGILGGPAQVYIAETAEPNLRGLLIGAPFVSYSLGILIVYALGSSLHWRAVAWCSVILPLLAALALLCIPESPAWLLRNKKQKQALKALTFLRGNSIVAQKELNDMQERLQRELATTKTNENIFQLCCQRVAIKPLFIVITFCFFQMFTGTFIVVFYAIDIISEFGGDFDTKTAAIWTAVVRILCTFICCFVLLFIKRRPIILVASLVSGLSCLVLSVYMYAHANTPKSFDDVIVSGVCLLTYIAFNTALMIMPGIMIGELFPAKIRGRTAGGVFAAMNVALFGFTKAFPYLQAQLKMRGVFMIFAISGFLVSIFMFMFQPETKGRSLDQIEDYFNEDNWLWLRRDRNSKFGQQDKLMQQEQQQCEKAECNS